MNTLRKTIAFAFLIFLLTACGAKAQNGILTASGTVETTEIVIAPELSGKVLEVLVDNGATVKAGDVLLKLDDTLLKAQRAIAVASLETAKAAALTAGSGVASAQAQYDIAANTALIQNMRTRSQDWYKTQVAEFDLPLWYFDQKEQIAAAQSIVDISQKALVEAANKLASMQSKASTADFIQAETTLATAQAQYTVAKNLHDRTQNGKTIDDLSRRQLFLLARDTFLESKDVEAKWVTLNFLVDKDLRDAAEKIFDDAEANLKDAQQAYDDAITTDGAKDVLRARAEMSVAEEHYRTAQDFVRVLQTGMDSPAVTAAQRVLDLAKSQAAQASSAINQAQANLDMLDVQLSKTSVLAPVDGVILNRSAEPGSVVAVGASTLTLGRLDKLTITVFVPEDRLGEVAMGQIATVVVDAFPGEQFTATVSHIADQAEFTPRNVQTVEGRKATVFAVELDLGDTAGKIKPGMPADVTFKAK
ncbi:MAG TPA: efflux RND transporter periplasmic adaptor subunit [Anaerolineales bacterium]|jgi:HlyD family secretion protein